MSQAAKWIKQTAIIVFLVVSLFSAVMWAQLQNEKKLERSQASSSSTPISTLPGNNASLTSDSDLSIKGDLSVDGTALFKGPITIMGEELSAEIEGKVLSIDQQGRLVLVDGQQSITKNNYITNTTTDLPSHSSGKFLYSDGSSWLVNSDLYYSDNSLAIGGDGVNGRLYVNTGKLDRVGLVVQGVEDQSSDLQQWLSNSGSVVSKITANGKLVLDNSADHLIELRPSGNTGYLSSSGGALFIENTYNLGTGIGIYSNAGADALGNMINVKVDNPLYDQAAFYMNYDGLSNAVEIVSNSTDSSSNALSVTGFNPNDSTVGIIGYETSRGTVKISHNGTGSDANASGISIDLKGTGTRAQGLYIDSTASGGTLGNLLRLRNQTVDRFVVDKDGSLIVGVYGTNTSITKYGNTTGDQFFVGTNGAFRVQRSATDSEAFRTQILGDSQGRWLGTADGKLKFGSGSAAQDVVLQRTGVGLFQMATDVEIVSQSTNNDVLTISASDGSRLGRFTETSGGHGWFEIDNATGNAVVLFRADGGDSYISSGNFGIGSTTFDDTANAVLTFGNGTAPAASIANGVQLWAEDVAASSELRVRDEAGNVSTLSPHNFSLIPSGPSEDMAWAFYSTKGDLAINADITRALRIVESLSGEKLVYVKNLATDQLIEETNMPAKNNYGNIEKLVEDKMQIALEDYLKKEDIAAHVSFGDKALTFISNLIVKTKATFEGAVEFLADVTFGGSITVNASTAGVITVPANTLSFKMRFDRPFNRKPLVYLSATDSTVEYRIEEITQEYFSVRLDNPVAHEFSMQWLALLSDDAKLNSLEAIQQESISIPEVTETSTASDSGVLEE